MTNLQKIQLRLSEVRQRLNTLAGEETPTDEHRAEMDSLMAEFASLETQQRAAIISESEQTEQPKEQTAENREIAKLLDKASIVDFALEADGHLLDGASRELREAVFGQNPLGFMPLEMLEFRADAVTNIPVSSDAVPNIPAGIMGRVFAESASQYMGVQSPTVPVGVHAYPRLSAGTTGDVRSPGVELDGTAAALTIETIEPVRLTASYTYGRETLSRVSGFEEALRTDIQGVLSEKRDALAINGQAAVANTSPLVDGIINSLTDPTDPTDVAVWTDFLDAYDDHVDGKYASSDGQVRMLVNSDTYKLARRLQIPTSGQLLRDLLPSGRFRVSANLPDTASTIATAISYASGAPGRGMLMPVWAGLEMLSDPYTLGKQGQRLLTATMMVGADLVDASAYKRLEFKLS